MMSLKPFRVSSSEFTSSITMDASTVEATTVTVAVVASRAEEPDILNAIYRFGAKHGLDFKPFYQRRMISSITSVNASPKRSFRINTPASLRLYTAMTRPGM
jgi:hypothetical protein